MRHETTHTILTGYPFFDHFLAFVVGILMAPGEAIMRSLAATAWGHEWGISATMPFTMIVAIFFWCVLFSILGAMDDVIRRTLHRKEPRELTPRERYTKPHLRNIAN